MTERDHGEDRDYPDGSVGRYVRERWGSVPTRPARAARPYVPPVEPPAPRPAPESETDNEAESADVWAYQPDAPWSHGPDASAETVRPEITETDHTQVDPGRAGASHDPFAGVEYGSATWATAGPGEEERAPEAERPPRARRQRPWPVGCSQAIPADSAARDGHAVADFPAQTGQ